MTVDTRAVNWEYVHYVRNLQEYGRPVMTRNGLAKRQIAASPIRFQTTPLVTVRKIAWRKALRELEWFLSGDDHCPDELLDWWAGQLDPDKRYISGYGDQWRRYGQRFFLTRSGYDQITALIDAIVQHPTSRRLIATTWNPPEMADITAINRNPDTPTPCHGTLLQAFVEDGMLHLTTYQRSADLLVGVPHNWMQYWALLLWLAHSTRLRPGYLTWLWGDLHLYQHPTHQATAHAMMDASLAKLTVPQLVYAPPAARPPFRAQDFHLDAPLPEPQVTCRPVLLVGGDDMTESL